MRRFGIYFYFLGTASAQLALGVAVLNHARRIGAVLLRRIAVAMLLAALMPFAFGAANLVMKSVLADAGPTENRIEWLSAIAMQAYFVALYVAWRETNFRVRVRAG